MFRVKITFPEQNASFRTILAIRITDLNYGNHLGNDRLLGILQEARVEWLHSLGYSETKIGADFGLIMADVMVAYKNEGFYGDRLSIELFVEGISKKSFDLLYRVSTARNGQQILIAEAKTAMVCYDYARKKVSALPAPFVEKIQRIG